MNHTKPFDFDSFKSGNPVTFPFDNKIVYVAGPNVQGDVAVIHCDNGRFDIVSLESLENSATMAPLCQIEDKPVFVGDILWYHTKKFSIVVTGYNPHVSDFSGLQGKVVERCSQNVQIGEITWAPFDCWNWGSQTIKKSGWINIYPLRGGDNYISSNVFDSKQEALSQAYPDVIDTIQIEWQESFQSTTQ